MNTLNVEASCIQPCVAVESGVEQDCYVVSTVQLQEGLGRVEQTVVDDVLHWNAVQEQNEVGVAVKLGSHRCASV